MPVLHRSALPASPLDAVASWLAEARTSGEQQPWVAYRLQPTSVEVWQGHAEDRRHDRFRYLRTADNWRLERLMP